MIYSTARLFQPTLSNVVVSLIPKLEPNSCNCSMCTTSQWQNVQGFVYGCIFVELNLIVIVIIHLAFSSKVPLIHVANI